MSDYRFLRDSSLKQRLSKIRSEREIINTTDKNLKEDLSTPPSTIVLNGSSVVAENKIKSSSTNGRSRVKSPSTKDLALSTKQLASMVRTGLPLLEALNIISASSDNKSLKIVYKEIAVGISRGTTLLENLEFYPNIFDQMYLALVSAGEASGKLPEVLERESKLLEALAKIKGQIRSAMAYPIGISVITVAVVVIMLLYVIPVFVGLYASSGADLPALTQLLVDLSNVIRDPINFLKALPIIVGFVIFWRFLFKLESFLYWRDSLFLRLPILSSLITKSCLANFSRTLSSLNDAGVPILESLLIAKRTFSNRVFQGVINRMYYEIENGQPIYKVLERESIIPVMFTSMFRIGEETGELSEMVSKLADFYEDEVSESVKALTSIMEPLMIVIVAGVVAVMLVAMYLPMFYMFETIR